MSVLIAEDHPGSGPAIAVMLTRAGYRVTLARSYPTALASLENDRPHALIADEGLPGGSGFDLIRRAKALDPGIYCLGMSASAHDLRGEALAAGADDFLAKPIEFDVMLPKLPPPVASAEHHP